MNCGALMDVEPMGPEFVRGMCHDIEDPTFDATAVATNPRAQLRPVHRPPRVPAARVPHCAWTVVIDDAHPLVAESEGSVALQQSAAAVLELAPIDALDAGAPDYSGPLLSDLDFTAFSHSALVRIADEVCLQMHLLVLGFRRAIGRRSSQAGARTMALRQLVGIAGVAAERIHRALALPGGVEDALRVLALHPLLNPAAYVDATVASSVAVRHSPAHDDGAWISLCGPDSCAPLQAAVRAVDPHLDVELVGTEENWTATVVRRDEPAPVADEVALTQLSTGAHFTFRPRRALPITPV
jgi:hypothetical protein